MILPGKPIDPIDNASFLRITRLGPFLLSRSINAYEFLLSIHQLFHQFIHPHFPGPAAHKARCSMWERTSWTRPTAHFPGVHGPAGRGLRVHRQQAQPLWEVLWSKYGQSIKANRAGASMTHEWLTCNNIHRYELKAETFLKITHCSELDFVFSLLVIHVGKCVFHWQGGRRRVLGDIGFVIVPTLKKMSTEGIKHTLQPTQMGNYF